MRRPLLSDADARTLAIQVVEQAAQQAFSDALGVVNDDAPLVWAGERRVWAFDLASDRHAAQLVVVERDGLCIAQVARVYRYVVWRLHEPPEAFFVSCAEALAWARDDRWGAHAVIALTRVGERHPLALMRAGRCYRTVDPTAEEDAHGPADP